MLTVGAGLVVLVKGALVAAVVRGFSVPLRTALAVGLSMAHVGEFAFVLLSHAVQQGILPLQVRRRERGGRWGWGSSTLPNRISSRA